jgi:hypothetical protein
MKASTIGVGLRIARAMRPIVLMLALVTFPATASAADPITDANVDVKMVQATTKEDHQALAVYFQRKADEAEKNVELHERMLSRFRAQVRKGRLGMRAHCRTLIRTSREAQGAYEDLADEHAQLAEEAGH